MATKKIANTAESWENGSLGQTEKFVTVADKSAEDALDEALGLQSISIRLPRQLIAEYKFIAEVHGVGYQPLMRDVLSRFVPHALKEIQDAYIASRAAEQANKELAMQEPERKAA
jgi:hypothetical protein